MIRSHDERRRKRATMLASAAFTSGHGRRKRVQARMHRAQVARSRPEATDRCDDFRTAERRNLIWEVQDTVMHQLSNVVLQVMGHRDSEQAPELRAVLGRVDDSSRHSVQDLRLLERLLREEALAGATSELAAVHVYLSPSAAAEAAAHALRQAGIRLSWDIPITVDAQPALIRSTVARMIHLAADELAARAPAGTECRLRVVATETALTATLDCPALPREPHEVVWCEQWAALRERVRLLGGGFTLTTVDGTTRATLVLTRD